MSWEENLTLATHTITGMRGVRDVVDRIEWSLRLGTDLFGAVPGRMYAFAWDGRVAFYRQSFASNGMPGPNVPQMGLQARWTNRHEAARMCVPTFTRFEFATDLPGDALERLENFRADGQVFARIEGRLTVVCSDANRRDTEILVDLAQLMIGNRRVPAADVCSEVIELRADNWCADVLATLRPQNRFVFAIETVEVSAASDRARRVTAHLAEARNCLDQRRYAEVARIAYRVLDELVAVAGQVERYGEFGRARFGDQIKAAKGLCNPDRHGQQPANDGLSADFELAKHILATVSSLAGTLLRAQ